MLSRIHTALAIIALSSIASHADTWNSTSATGTILPSSAASNVGIGLTTGLAGKFQVNGGTAASGAGLPIILTGQQGAANNVGGNILISSGPNGTGSTNGSILFGIGGTLGAGGTLVNGEKMRIDPTGKVGIGLNQPVVPLDILGAHVSGYGILRASSSDHSMIVANAAAGGFESGLRLSNGNSIMWDIAQNESGTGNSLTLGTGTISFFKMLRTNGFLGLGAGNTPIVPLDVSGTHITGQGIIRANSTSHSLIVANAAAGAYESGLRLSSNNTIMWDISQNEAGSGNNLSFTDGTTRYVSILRSNGYMSIGANSTPIVALDVTGSHVTGQGIIRANSNNHALIVANAASNSFESGIRLSSNNTLMWDIAQNESATGNNLSFSNGTTQYVAISRATGNVGIGTAPSSFKLDVNGTTNISGALTVGSVNTHTWSIIPDYVFEKDYNLPTLEIVHDFVKKNKHLPDVPSARELNDKGMNLAEMNLKLLKKVEELTLYMINQNQAIAKQADEIEELKSKSKRLERLAGLRN